MPEIDLQAVILDGTDEWRSKGRLDPGFISPVTQLNYLFNRSVPCATIPWRRMKTLDDKMRDAPAFQQAGLNSSCGSCDGRVDSRGRQCQGALGGGGCPGRQPRATPRGDSEDQSTMKTTCLALLLARGLGALSIGWKTADGKWTAHACNARFVAAAPTASDSWQEIHGLVEVPPGAGQLIFMAAADGQAGESDTCLFKDAVLTPMLTDE